MTEPRRYGRGSARPAPMPVEALRQVLAYDPETGVLTWKDCPPGYRNARRMPVGASAGCANFYGYIVVRVNKVLYPAHRLAWYLQTGEWPPEQIDHINGLKGDNRLCNLRLASHADNTRYRHQARIARDGPKPPRPPSTIADGYKMGPATAEELSQVLAYEPETGLLTWREDRGCNFNKRKAGTVAGGCKADGYIVVRVGKTLYKAHRVIWVLMTGEWPRGEIDHINGIKWDNRWTNIQLATRSQNQHRRARKKLGKSGYRGVSRNGNGFKAQISINGKLIHYPTRATAEEAAADYIAAARLYHGKHALID